MFILILQIAFIVLLITNIILSYWIYSFDYPFRAPAFRQSSQNTCG